MFGYDRIVCVKDIKDGTANTLLVVEGTSPVFWSKPEDLSLTSSNPLLKMGSKHPGGFTAASVDGAVQFILQLGNLKSRQ